MAYSELIKNFERIRDYMRQFYVYGFRSRSEYDAKSARSYDNERRRIESWLSDYMAFRQEPGGKRVFLSVDSRSAGENPLYKAFKAKSFTDNDITFHFYILDALSDGGRYTVSDIMAAFANYGEELDEPFEWDESTVRKKLREYVKLGLLNGEKQGRELVYSISVDGVDMAKLWDAVAFFSEEAPLGVIGSFLLDKAGERPDFFRFKHHYILHALDSQILCDILSARQERRNIEIVQNGLSFTLYPMKIYVSTQTGRHYLLGYSFAKGATAFFRLDTITWVKILEKEPQADRYDGIYPELAQKLWGVSAGTGNGTDCVEMTVHIGANEGYIIDRLQREKRWGAVERLDGNTYRYTAEVYDAVEMLPWIRTFTGRIIELKSDNKRLLDTFYRDLEAMNEAYGGAGHVV